MITDNIKTHFSCSAYTEQTLACIVEGVGRYIYRFCYKVYYPWMLCPQTLYHSVRKVTDFFSFSCCKNLVDFNKARLHKATLNLHTYAWFVSCLLISSVDGNQHLSEIVFSGLVRFSSVRKVSYLIFCQKSTTRIFCDVYMMLCGARDRRCGQRAIDTSITIMLQHILRTWFRFFGKKPDSCCLPGSLLSWYGSLWLLAVPQTQEATDRKAILGKKRHYYCNNSRAKHHSKRGFLEMFPTMEAPLRKVCGCQGLWGWLGS